MTIPISRRRGSDCCLWCSLVSAWDTVHAAEMCGLVGGMGSGGQMTLKYFLVLICSWSKQSQIWGLGFGELNGDISMSGAGTVANPSRVSCGSRDLQRTIAFPKHSNLNPIQKQTFALTHWLSLSLDRHPNSLRTSAETTNALESIHPTELPPQPIHRCRILPLNYFRAVPHLVQSKAP